MTTPAGNVFRGRNLVVATMHGKERVISPLVERYLGVHTILPPKSFNSDLFGTFTREIKRAGNQLEAARKKARAAIELTGCDLAISNEGSFGTHPSIPFVQSNLELMLLVDKKNGYEIRGHYRTPKTNAHGQYVKSPGEAMDAAKKLDFPNHGLIVRRTETSKEIFKNIDTMAELENIVQKLFKRPFTKKIYLETDLRAHRNPTRMAAIEEATKDLLKNIASVCPKCFAPGFVIAEIEKGLKCSQCDVPTELPISEIYLCSQCHYREKKEITDYGSKADPRYCAYCNP